MDRSSLSVNDEDKNSLVPNFFLFDLFYPNNPSPPSPPERSVPLTLCCDSSKLHLGLPPAKHHPSSKRPLTPGVSNPTRRNPLRFGSLYWTPSLTFQLALDNRPPGHFSAFPFPVQPNTVSQRENDAGDWEVCAIERARVAPESGSRLFLFRLDSLLCRSWPRISSSLARVAFSGLVYQLGSSPGFSLLSSLPPPSRCRRLLAPSESTGSFPSSAAQPLPSLPFAAGSV